MRDLLEFENTLSASHRRVLEDALSGCDVIRGANTATIRRLTGLIANNRHSRIPFFNEPDGFRIHPRIQTHNPVQRRPARWGVLCGSVRNRATGHQTTHYCSFCTVHLFIKAMSGAEQSCWLVWHTKETITPPAAAGASQSNMGNVEIFTAEVCDDNR